MWNYLYEVLPFIVTIAFKLTLASALHRTVQRGLRGVPGGDQMSLDNDAVVRLLADHVSHAEDKILVILSFLSSVFAAAVWGAKEELVGPGIIGAFVLTILGGWIFVYIHDREAGTLYQAKKGRNGILPATIVSAANIFVDVVFILLISFAYVYHLPRSQPAAEQPQIAGSRPANQPTSPSGSASAK